MLRLFRMIAGFQVEKFTPKDYQTICSLIKERYPVFNEAIELHKDIRLLDDKNKLIGVYEASEARRKASNLRKDIVLVNKASSPAVCKLINFRENMLKKFYDEIVNKRNEQLLQKAASTKQLKVSHALSANQLEIKARQILQLAKKNLNVRIFMNCRSSQSEEALSKMENLKSMIQNKCIVERDVRYEETEEEEDEPNKKTKERRLTFAMVVKSRENEFINMINESSIKEPEIAISSFLKRYYKQEDVEMKDLRATASLQMDELSEKEELVAVKKTKKEGDEEGIKPGSVGVSEFEIKMLNMENSFQVREAKARILNERLRRILASGG